HHAVPPRAEFRAAAVLFPSPAIVRATRSWPPLRAIREKRRQRSAKQQCSPDRRRNPCLLQVDGRDLRLWRQVVSTHISANYEECMRAANAGIRGIVKLRIVHAALMQFFDPRFRFISQHLNLAELNGFRRAGLRAGGNQAHLLPVVTERALERPAVIHVLFNHAEWTGNHAIPAPVADVRLNEHSTEFRSNNRTRGTSLQAPGIFAVLANIGREGPRIKLGRITAKSRLRLMLYEFDVTPSRMSDRTGVVITVPTPIQPIFADLVPFLTCDLAGFAANAERRIG